MLVVLRLRADKQNAHAIKPNAEGGSAKIRICDVDIRLYNHSADIERK